MFNVFLNSPILTVLTILFAVTSSITTFDKRLIQAKKAGTVPSNEPILPNWVGIISWAHWGIMLTIFLINWKYAIGLFIIGFILEVLPVWETIGNILMSPFRPKK